MNIFKKKPKKLKQGTPCSFCPNIIHLHNEVGGVLWVASGKPICATCRVMRKNPLAKKMKSDAKKANDILEVERINDVAVASQISAGAESDSPKKKALMKKLNKK